MELLHLPVPVDMSPLWTPAENRRVGGKSRRARIVLEPCLGGWGGGGVAGSCMGDHSNPPFGYSPRWVLKSLPLLVSSSSPFHHILSSHRPIR